MWQLSGSLPPSQTPAVLSASPRALFEALCLLPVGPASLSHCRVGFVV